MVLRLNLNSRLAEQPLRVIARCARYESHKASAVLYRKNQISTCWYILLGGSVFIGGNMYLPPYR
uniref:Cyclic nucleotide-binding domain-containing protein n=1 Tax=Romanomermis culicivorax TaxID=13658 RepID=A0A915JER6_ROMCU